MSENLFIHKEAFWMLAGDLIGRGCSRQVFVCKFNPDLVVKVEEGAGSFHNVTEWNAWREVQYTKWSRWFAPCVAISASGSVLVQARTRPAPLDMYPDRMPEFLSDFKHTNYGMYQGRLVCHDYGLNNLMSVGLSDRLHKAHWSSGEGISG